MTDLHELLTAVHKMTGGYGVRIKTTTINYVSRDYLVEVYWRVRYRNEIGHGECSVKRKSSGNTVEEALRNALVRNAEIEAMLRGALAERGKA